MKESVFIFFLSLVLSGCTTTSNFDSIKEEELVKLGDKVSTWQIDSFSYHKMESLHDYGIDSWANAVFYLGLSRWASISEKGDEYYSWLRDSIGAINDWQIATKFVDHPHYGIYHADELCMGQFYFELYKKYSAPEIILNTKERLDLIMSNPPDTTMSYLNKQSWTWCDALFMAPPVYLEMSLLTGDFSYLDFMHANFMATYHHLYDTEEQLFYRDSSYFEKREANGKKIFWGRGNGWVIAGLANILQLLPEDDEKRSFYVELYTIIATKLVQLQHPDGFWHASLLDPDSYPAPETSGTALITYALAYGINSHILTDSVYFDSLTNAWKSLCLTVEESGKLGWVQPIGADPKTVTSEMTAVYGVGAFLLAASEIYKM